MTPFPDTIDSVETLEELLSRPTPGLVTMRGRLEGDIIFLGAGGKMGPTMARMARRASEEARVQRRIYAASRFSNRKAEAELQAWGVETIRCDLLDPGQVAALPQVPNVVYMTGMKFGATGQEAMTWAMNTWLPSLICQHYSESRIVAFSTGNVYGLTPLSRGGSVESDTLHPIGEYATSAMGRERIFEYFSQTNEYPAAQLRHGNALRRAGRRGPTGLSGTTRQSRDGQPQRDLARGCQCHVAPRARANTDAGLDD